MSLILSIDTTTDVCSVAISEEANVIVLKEDLEGRNHGSMTTVLVEQAFREAGINKNDLSAIAVSSGPGSYTGLRIGFSVAKGLCYALDTPLIVVDTLLAEVIKYKSNTQKSFQYYCSVIEAREQEVFVGVYDNEDVCVLSPALIDLSQSGWAIDLSNNFADMVVFGNIEKYKNAFAGVSNSVDCIFSPNSVRYLVPIANKKMQNKDFENLAYSKPSYLKDFFVHQAKVSK